ncbi:MAG TPA: 2-hydroxyacyl-CoA dehydratase family protein, partial [Dongiaceae bacterium]|nr:2-hydroxyacyl-CoA dehydratase family protein [Dongiaceae bacterium]
PSSSARQFAEAVASFQWEGAFSSAPAAAPGKTVSLAIVGGPFCSAHWPLLEVLEAAGGRVVLNATESGERSLCPSCEFAADNDEPFEVLLNGYFGGIVDVFPRPNTRLYTWLRPRLRSREVRGIVLWHFTGCDLWRAEAPSLREAFGLPVLLLEAEEAPGASPRAVNRLQAFVETLK